MQGVMTRACWDDRNAHLRQELISALGPLGRGLKYPGHHSRQAGGLRSAREPDRIRSVG